MLGVGGCSLLGDTKILGGEGECWEILGIWDVGRCWDILGTWDAGEHGILGDAGRYWGMWDAGEYGMLGNTGR